ncbi:MAG: hypothetical protein A2W29_14015 [Gemmatimonadetes bacterium RBG_16_66_8]|nr:MAG: hypothetical protein A2W29_14015 [Gemmatimonadetes bacterium RBG_16_66_8]
MTGLGRRPDGGPVALNIGDSAGRAERSVQLVRVVVDRLHNVGGPRELRVHVPGVDDERIARRLLVSEMLVEATLARQPDTTRPAGLEGSRGLDRLPRLLRDHADEIPPDDHLDESRDAANRSFVHADQRGAHLRRPDDSAVQHARHTHVVHELELPGDHGRELHTWDGRAQHGPLTRMPAPGVRVERDVELPAADQLAVADASPRIGPDGNDSLGRRELVGRDVEALRRQPEQRFACRGRGLRQVAVVEVLWVRLAAGRGALIRSDRRVALDQRDAIERHDQLFRDELRLSRQEALAQLALASVRRHPAILGDGNPRVDLTAR